MKAFRSSVLVMLVAGIAQAQVIPTTTWTDFYSNLSTANGLPLPVGSVVQAFDPQGVMCGEFVTHTEGSYGYLHVYGDDSSTPEIDEGAAYGDTIRFRIQGVDAVGYGIWVGGRDIVEAHLHANLPPPGRPVLTQPLDLASDVNRPVSLQWAITTGTFPFVGVTTSRVQVARDRSFVDMVVDSAGVAGTQLTVSGLHGGRLYFWRVRVNNSVSGDGEFSDTSAFSTAVTAIATLSESSVIFPVTAVGDTTRKVVVLLNTSEDSVMVSAIGSHHPEFSVNPSSGILGGGESMTLQIAYHPSGFGQHTDTLLVHSDAATPRLTAVLSGSSPEPSLRVQPVAIDFGTVRSNNSDSVALVLSSTTVNAVRIDSIRTQSPSFTVRTGSLPVVLSGTDSIMAWAIFGPDTGREFIDTLVIHSRIVLDGRDLAARIPLRGVGEEEIPVHVNHAPVLTSEFTDTTIQEGTTLVFAFAASDADGDPLTYSKLSGPAGASIVGNTGLFSWSIGYTDAGRDTIRIRVTDGELSDTATIVVTVTNVDRPPVFVSALPDTTLPGGAIISFTYVASDPDGEVVRYHAATLPAGALLDPVTGAFQWTVPFQIVSPVNVTVHAVSGDDSVATTASLTILNVSYGVSLSAGTLHMGNVTVGAAKDSLLTITNTGNTTLSISSITSTNAAFVPRPGSLTIAAGQTATDTIRFTPTKPGADSAWIIITSNAPSSPDSVLVTGYGMSYGVSLNAGTIQMGNVTVGAAKDSLLTITNTGNATLNISSITSTNAAFVPRPGSVTIAAGQTATDTIRFTPSKPGADSAWIIITSNAPSSPDSVLFTGYGTVYSLSVSARSIHLSSTAVGTTRDTVISITNTGNQPIVITDIVSSNSLLTVSHRQYTIQPGADVKDTLSFKPTSLGPVSGTIVILSNASSSPDTITVTANGATTSVLTELGVPTEYSLGQNYPNPFNPSTTLWYCIPQRSNVTLTIYNSLGQRIALIEKQDIEAGAYEQTFEASHLPSGLYFYRMEATGFEDPPNVFVQTRKMVLVK